MHWYIFRDEIVLTLKDKEKRQKIALNKLKQKMEN